MTDKNKTEILSSALYTGWVGHRRMHPVPHSFRYRVFMIYLDLDELDKVFSYSLFWSKAKFAPAKFRREDFYGDASIPLAQAVKEKIQDSLQIDVDGPIRMLTNLRYFGFIINPLTIYYCFDSNEKLVALLLEVTNTPWGKRHQYALRCNAESQNNKQIFRKEHHVSPFHHMHILYDWTNSVPAESLCVHMKNRDVSNGKNEVIFDATMSFKRKDISVVALNTILFIYPFMTLKVFASIYWEALKLAIKKTPFYKYPKRKNDTGIQSEIKKQPY